MTNLVGLKIIRKKQDLSKASGFTYTFELLNEPEENLRILKYSFNEVFYVDQFPHIYRENDENDENDENEDNRHEGVSYYRIDVMSPDMKQIIRVHRINVWYTVVRRFFLHSFQYFGEGYVLAGQESTYYVIDIEQARIDILMSNELRNTADDHRVWIEGFSSLRKLQGHMYWYDVEGYMKGLVDARKELKSQTKLGKRGNYKDDNNKKRQKEFHGGKKLKE